MQNSKNDQFDILIVGAGLLGSSTAMHLAQFGAKSVGVIDADMAGRLSSSELNAGGARATWDQPVNVELAQASLDHFRKNKDAVGFRECGYLWMYGPEGFGAARERGKKLQAKYGVPIEELDVAGLQAKLPFVDKTSDLAGAIFSPGDGLFNPNLVKNRMREDARAAGAVFLEGHRVTRVVNATDVYCDLIPPKNESDLKNFYETEPRHQTQENDTKLVRGKILVNCAGPWASWIAKLIGYEAPVWAVRRQVSIFDCRSLDFTPYGMVIDKSGVYFHPEANNILGGYADHEEARGHNLNYDGQAFFEEKIWAPLYERSSHFAELKHITGWGGLYEETPDKTAILGRAPGLKNVYENHGYSGRGAMQSYAAGRGLAELIHFGKFQTIDLSSMTGERFSKGGAALLPEGLLI